MDDIKILKKYKFARTFLEKIHKLSNEIIPATPIIKVIEDGLIVGIITETDQFIPVQPQMANVGQDDDNLDTIEDYNFNELNIATTIRDVNEIDKERIKMTKRIQLESHFYNVFRNTVRVLLNKHEFIEIRNEIKDIIQESFSSLY